MVPITTMFILVINLLLAIAVPVYLAVHLRRKYKAELFPLFLGLLVMVVFALILEQRVHAIVLGSSAGAVILNQPILYGLYGGIMAGLFEETGRFLAMRVLYKDKKQDKAQEKTQLSQNQKAAAADGGQGKKSLYTALMYGVGHGGIEMILVMAINALNNLIYAFMLNSGQAQTLLAPLDAAGQASVQSVFDALQNTASWVFALAPIERLAALTAQMGLSVIVWAAFAKKGGVRFYLLAILLHAVLDASAGILSGYGVPTVAIEVVVWIIALAIALIARKIWEEK